MSVYKQGEQRDEQGKDKKKKDFFEEVGEEFDKWGNKLSKMFTSKSKHWERKGEGHSLGTAEDAAAAAERRRMAPDAAGNQAANAAAARAHAPGGVGAPQLYGVRGSRRGMLQPPVDAAAGQLRQPRALESSACHVGLH